MEKDIVRYIGEVLSDLYVVDLKSVTISLERTKPGIEGDFTVVVFPFTKYSKKSPMDTAKEIGVSLKSRCEDIDSYNVIQGFLNLTMTHEYWLKRLNNLASPSKKKDSAKKPLIMVEFSSPNTNKPLHLGHLRNNFLGDSVSRIIKAAGNNVMKVNLVNDRGIHICKSMIAWLKWGNGVTPESAGKKGDKLVGDFYVLFSNKYKEEIAQLKAQGLSDEEAEKLADACSNQNVCYPQLESFDVVEEGAGDEEDGNAAMNEKKDKLLFEVAKWAIECGNGLSTSAVQRHFSVGYSRAGKIVDQLFGMGLCARSTGNSKPRAMLIDMDQLMQLERSGAFR